MVGHDCHPSAVRHAPAIRCAILLHIRPVHPLAARHLHVHPCKHLASFLQHVRPVHVRSDDGAGARSAKIPVLLHLLRHRCRIGAGRCLRHNDPPLRIGFPERRFADISPATPVSHKPGTVQHRHKPSRTGSAPDFRALPYTHNRSIRRDIRHPPCIRIHVPQHTPLSHLPTDTHQSPCICAHLRRH